MLNAEGTAAVAAAISYLGGPGDFERRRGHATCHRGSNSASGRFQEKEDATSVMKRDEQAAKCRKRTSRERRPRAHEPQASQRRRRRNQATARIVLHRY